MQPRTFIIVVSLLAAVGALFLLGTGVSATTAGGATVACGSGFHTDMSQAAHDSRVNALSNAMLADSGYGSLASSDKTTGYAQQCESALSTRRGWSFGLLALAAVGLLGGLTVRRSPARPTTDTPAVD